jgi:hypothetical protein
VSTLEQRVTNLKRDTANEAEAKFAKKLKEDKQT